MFIEGKQPIRANPLSDFIFIFLYPLRQYKLIKNALHKRLVAST